MSCASLPRLGLLAVPLLLTLALPAHARQSFVVIDKNSKVVGPILDMVDGDNGRARIPFRVSAHRIMLTLSPSGFDKKGYLFFESSDCTGQPYANNTVAGVGGLLSDAMVGGDRHSLYVPDGSARNHTVRSMLTFQTGVCEPIQTQTRLFRVARHVVDLDTRFTRPFRISAALELTDLNVP
ncbi:hypothetical protein [Pseudomonas sp. CGJS7]|uniref:hypothetical protein n=1 Tax=Pseudomonas sp. CGJS7 TaxID=3109348 RepID=UPI00300A51DB